MITRIDMHWIRDFDGRGVMTLEFTIDQQDDPLLLALKQRWNDQQAAKIAAAPRDGNPFPTG